MKQKKLAIAVISALSVMATATAQTNSNKEIELPRIDVIGGTSDDVKKTPGAVSIVNKEELQLSNLYLLRLRLKQYLASISSPKRKVPSSPILVCAVLAQGMAISMW